MHSMIDSMLSVSVSTPVISLKRNPADAVLILETPNEARVYYIKPDTKKPEVQIVSSRQALSTLCGQLD